MKIINISVKNMARVPGFAFLRTAPRRLSGGEAVRRDSRKFALFVKIRAAPRWRRGSKIRVPDFGWERSDFGPCNDNKPGFAFKIPRSAFGIPLPHAPCSMPSAPSPLQHQHPIIEDAAHEQFVFPNRRYRRA